MPKEMPGPKLGESSGYHCFYTVCVGMAREYVVLQKPDEVAALRMRADELPNRPAEIRDLAVVFGQRVTFTPTEVVKTYSVNHD